MRDRDAGSLGFGDRLCDGSTIGGGVVAVPFGALRDTPFGRLSASLAGAQLTWLDLRLAIWVSPYGPLLVAPVLGFARRE